MIFDHNTPWLLLAALALDAMIGDPDWLWRRLPHPVVLFGRGISAFDTHRNRPDFTPMRQRVEGLAAIIALVCVALLIGLIATVTFANPFANVLNDFITIVIAAMLLAQRSLYEHVARVRAAFETGIATGNGIRATDADATSNLDAARHAVSMIVGRDPKTLDEAGVVRASIETTAENFSDGVVAPAFWFLVAGLPGILAYKMINTADSMIGHRSPRYRDFGWAAARIDDAANLIPARLAGLLIVVAALPSRANITRAFRTMWSDAGKHKSPNAGWPEAAMAGALNLALAGPRIYKGVPVQDPWLNANGNRSAHPADISAALAHYTRACALLAVAVLATAVIVTAFGLDLDAGG